MWWVIAIIVIIAAFAFPRFGVVLLVLLALAGGGLFMAHLNNQQERAASTRRMTTTEVELTDLRLGRQYGSSYKLVGRVRNASPKYTLQEFSLRILVRDCAEPQTCETIGETTDSVYVSVPPGQIRGIDESIHFSALPALKGTFAWEYSLVEVKAK